MSSAIKPTLDHDAKSITTIEELTQQFTGILAESSELKNEQLIPELVKYFQESAKKDSPSFYLAFKSGLIIATVQTIQESRAELVKIKQRMQTLNYTPTATRKATKQLIVSLIAQQVEQTKKRLEKNEQALTETQIEARVIIKDAISQKASDIHIYLYDDEAAQMYYRIGGYLKARQSLPAEKLGKVIASLFTTEAKSYTEIYNEKTPADATVTIDLNQEENEESDLVSLRLAKSGMKGGMIFVARILGAGELLKLDQLNFDVDQEYLIRQAANYPNGAILISGPTGSGKTNTLAATILESSHEVKSSIEDPVEINIPNVRQAQVDHKDEKMSFVNLIRAKLREDVDLLSVGEVRDTETASTFMNMALTGHLCLGSIHTNSATETILRLSEQGIPPTIMANTLKMLVSQRLIASVCKHCSISASRFKAFEAKKIPMPQKPRISSRNKADRAILEKFEADRLEYIRLQAMSNNYFQEAKVVLFNSFKNDLDSVRMRNSLGCEHCSQGRDGRILVAEVVKVDDNGKKFILELDTPSWNKYLNEQGFKSICERARRKITAGLIDPFDTNQIIDGVFEENTFTFNYSDLEALLTNKKRIA